MFTHVGPESRHNNPTAYFGSLLVHILGGLILLYGAAMHGRSAVHMMSPEMMNSMDLYMPPELSTHALSAPAPAPEPDPLPAPAKDAEKQPLPEPAKDEAPKPEAKPEEPKPTEAATAQTQGYQETPMTRPAPPMPNMAAMMAYMMQHHQVRDPQAIYTPVPPELKGKLPPETNGYVVVEFTIGADGRVSDVKVLEPAGTAIEQQLIQAIQQWRFVPASMNGQDIPARHQFRVHIG